MYMCHCRIQFYDKILKIGHKGQRSRSISIIFDIPTLRQSSMQRAMLGFQLLYIFEGKHLNNHNQQDGNWMDLDSFLNHLWSQHEIIDRREKRKVQSNTESSLLIQKHDMQYMT